MDLRAKPLNWLAMEFHLVADALLQGEQSPESLSRLRGRKDAILAELRRREEVWRQVEQRLAAALRFVPAPHEMSGHNDPDAPDEVRALIQLAAFARGLLGTWSKRDY